MKIWVDDIIETLKEHENLKVYFGKIKNEELLKERVKAYLTYLTGGS